MIMCFGMIHKRKYQKISIFRNFDHFASDFFDMKERFSNEVFSSGSSQHSLKKLETKTESKNIWTIMEGGERGVSPKNC